MFIFVTGVKIMESFSPGKVFASISLGDYVIKEYIIKRLRDRKVYGQSTKSEKHLIKFNTNFKKL